VNLGLAQSRRSAWHEALATLRWAARLGANDAEFSLYLGRALHRSGALDEAARVLRGAARRAERSAGIQAWGMALEARLEIAPVEQAGGNRERAERELRHVLAAAPGMPEARYLLSRLLSAAQREREAEEQREHFEQAARVVAAVQARLADGDEPNRHEFAARAYASLGILHLAETHYQILLARNPGSVGYRGAQAQLKQRLSSHKAGSSAAAETRTEPGPKG
jgi:tetratricopeptide (TPR) repeat protein